MKVLTTTICLMLLAVPAFSQQPQPDPSLLQYAAAALQAQRNAAWDQAANAEVRAAILAEKLAKAEARIKELELKDKPADAPK